MSSLVGMTPTGLRRCLALTLCLLFVYFMCHVYMVVSLWCPDGSPVCYSHGPPGDGDGDHNNNRNHNNHNTNTSRSSAHRQLLPKQGDITGLTPSLLDLGKDGDLQRSSPVSSPSPPPSSSPPPPSSSPFTSLLNQTIKAIQDYHAKTMTYRRQFDCPAIVNGSQSEIQKVLTYHHAHRPTQGYPPSDPFRARSMFYDCRAFRRIRGYSAESGDKEELSFPLAYVILAHKDLDHVERLLRALYRPQHSFCIHLDHKVKDHLKQAVAGLASCFSNVIMASSPQDIVYAHSSRLMADIGCMKDLVKQGRGWRYLINTAATGFPLKTNRETVRILQVLNGKNDIHEVFALRVPARWKLEYRVEKGRMRPTNKELPPPPHNLTVVKGQAYNTYSRAFVQWVFSDQRAKDLLHWSLSTYSPDEHYWATLNNVYHNPHLNTPGGYTGHPDKKGYITMHAVWAKNSIQGHTCQGHNVHNICVCAAGDLDYLTHRRTLTANKFDLGYDPVAYSCMEEWLERRTLTSDINTFDLNRYKRLRFVWYDKEKEKKAEEEARRKKEEGKKKKEEEGLNKMKTVSDFDRKKVREEKNKGKNQKKGEK